MKKTAFRKNGNLFLTFILLVAVAAVLMSFFFILIGRVRTFPQDKNRVRAFYIAEAGIQKAIWNITTPVGLGGQGSSWRTAGLTESFGGGQYTVSVLDGAAGSITISSTGEVEGTARCLQQSMTSSSLPVAFNYGIYNNGNLTLSGNSKIKGDIFSNGNMIISGNSNHSTGGTYVSPGHTVKVGGVIVPATVLDPAPALPTINTAPYDSAIATALTYPSANKSYSSLNLAGGTTYVHGNATISGAVTGGGTLVVSGTTTISGNVTVAPGTTIISNKTMTISGNTNFQTGAVLYSATKITDSGNNRLNGSIMAPTITIGGNDTIYGFLYAWGVSVTISGNVNVYGAVVNPSTATYSGNITISYDPSYLPPPPPGLSGGGFSLIKGSFKELY
jgi:hypothetical protein